MTLTQYKNESKFYKSWEVSFPTYFKCIDNKYFAFNVIYSVKSLDRLITGFLTENFNELSKCLELEKQIKEVFLKENYGSINEMDVINKPNETNTVILSYDGLSDDGEFNRTTTNHFGDSTNNTKNKSVNNLEIFLNLNQIKLNSLYGDLVTDFGYLFLQLCYN